MSLNNFQMGTTISRLLGVPNETVTRSLSLEYTINEDFSPHGTNLKGSIVTFKLATKRYHSTFEMDTPLANNVVFEGTLVNGDSNKWIVIGTIEMTLGNSRELFPGVRVSVVDESRIAINENIVSFA